LQVGKSKFRCIIVIHTEYKVIIEAKTKQTSMSLI